MNKYKGSYKHVFHIGDEGDMKSASPLVFLDETENKLYLVCRGSGGLPADYLGFEVIDFNWPIIYFMKLHDIFFQKYLMNPKNNRDNFLFLTGKPLGYHRVGLLYKIWKHNLIEKCQYSFFGNKNEFPDSCSQYIDIEDRQGFFYWVKKKKKLNASNT